MRTGIVDIDILLCSLLLKGASSFGALILNGSVHELIWCCVVDLAVLVGG